MKLIDAADHSAQVLHRDWQACGVFVGKCRAPLVVVVLHQSLAVEDQLENRHFALHRIVFVTRAERREYLAILGGMQQLERAICAHRSDAIDQPVAKPLGRAFQRRLGAQRVKLAPIVKFLAFGNELQQVGLCRLAHLALLAVHFALGCGLLARGPRRRLHDGDRGEGAHHNRGGLLRYGRQCDACRDQGESSLPHSAAFSSNPLAIWSRGSTGYSPEKQASQYCGLSGLRPSASPTAR